MHWLIVIVSFGIFSFPLSTCYSQNFLVLLKDGREIRADIYGYEGDQVRLHQNEKTWEINRGFIKEIKRLQKPIQTPDKQHKGRYDQQSRQTSYKVSGAQLTTFEQGYVSSLGKASIQQEFQWLSDVLLQAKGDPCDVAIHPGGYAIRWTGSPTLSVFGATEAGERAARKAVNEINNALAKTPIKIISLEPNDSLAKIRVIFSLTRSFPSEPTVDSSRFDGRCHIKGVSFRTPEIKSAAIWIATDKSFEQGFSFLSEAQRMAVGKVLLEQHWQRIILHELVHALGLFHSAVFEDSTMYCELINGHPEGNARTFLSARDKEVIKFFYSRVFPGWREDKLGEAVKRYWRDF
ncbi:MAG: hypothetical protein JRI95_06925 [Deltaproteobacteria bacterium]|nr:hypothetical protein [Deltaproteobacteria bacterium]MBW2086208.1 hypothetical protein [Deltaproteobacteria bacterium]